MTDGVLVGREVATHVPVKMSCRVCPYAVLALVRIINNPNQARPGDKRSSRPTTVNNQTSPHARETLEHRQKDVEVVTRNLELERAKNHQLLTEVCCRHHTYGQIFREGGGGTFPPGFLHVCGFSGGCDYPNTFREVRESKHHHVLVEIYRDHNVR